MGVRVVSLSTGEVMERKAVVAVERGRLARCCSKAVRPTKLSRCWTRGQQSVVGGGGRVVGRFSKEEGINLPTSSCSCWLIYSAVVTSQLLVWRLGMRKRQRCKVEAGSE